MGVTKGRIEASTKSMPHAASDTKKKAKHDNDVKADAQSKAQQNKNNTAREAGGLDEIESLFADKKKKEKEKQQEVEQRKGKNRVSVPPRQQQSTSVANWVDDGLGGKYNSEGFTGRVEDGMKIFKTHLLQSKKSGTTPECPFDCNCCFI
jgi:hypothetical protein